MADLSPWLLLVLTLGAFLSAVVSDGRRGASAARGADPRLGGPRARVLPRLSTLLTYMPAVYLTVIAVAELAIVLDDAQWGMILNLGLLVALLIHVSLVHNNEALRHFLLALVLAPVIRVISLSLPLQDVERVYWYGVLSIPILAAAFVVARSMGLTRQQLGLTRGSLPVQALIALSGFLIGFIEYFILRPDPLITELSLRSVWAPALVLMVGTGFAASCSPPPGRRWVSARLSISR